MKKLLLFFALFLVINAFAKNETCNGIEAGSKAYNSNNFERAIDEWRTCVDNGIIDADLFYNLGNAYFRNGNLGFSILYYKKALRLKANDKDILHNLKYAQAMTKDKIEEEEENPILSTLFEIHHALSLKTQLLTILIIFWIIAFINLLRRIFIKEKQKNLCIGIVFILSVFFCIIGASATYKIIVAETDITGVVTSNDADVMSAPSDKSQTLNTLSEGTSFEVLSIQGSFAQIKLGEKVKGFINLSEIGIVD